MTTIMYARTGQVLGVVNGRESAAVTGWLRPRNRRGGNESLWVGIAKHLDYPVDEPPKQAWRHRITVGAIDPSGALKKAITGCSPNVKIAVDRFHIWSNSATCADQRPATTRPRGTPAAMPPTSPCHYPRCRNVPRNRSVQVGASRVGKLSSSLAMTVRPRWAIRGVGRTGAGSRGCAKRSGARPCGTRARRNLRQGGYRYSSPR